MSANRKHQHREPSSPAVTGRQTHAAVLILALILLLAGVGLWGAVWSGLLTAMREAL
jgi:hypothetical protein